VNTEHFINKEVFFKCPASLQGFASVVCQLFSFFFKYKTALPQKITR